MSNDLEKKVRSWAWHRLVFLADRISPEDAFRATGYSMRLVRGTGWKFEEHDGENGVQLWYKGVREYDEHAYDKYDEAHVIGHTTLSVGNLRLSSDMTPEEVEKATRNALWWGIELMRRVRLDDDGCSVNFDHIVMLERKNGYQFVRLVSGSTVGLKDVYPLAHELFRLSEDVWVNPKYVSTVGIGYNKDAAFRDVMASSIQRPDDYYKQIQVETVLGSNFAVWPDLYRLDELDYLAGLLLDGETND